MYTWNSIKKEVLPEYLFLLCKFWDRCKYSREYLIDRSMRIHFAPGIREHRELRGFAVATHNSLKEIASHLLELVPGRIKGSGERFIDAYVHREDEVWEHLSDCLSVDIHDHIESESTSLSLIRER